MLQKFILPLLLMFSALVLTACGNNSPESIAKAFYQAVEQKDADKAYHLLAIPEKEKKENEAAIKGKVQMIVNDMAARIERNGGVKSTDVASVEVDKEKRKATVVLTVIFNDGQQKDERFLLTEEQSGWKIILR